MSGLAILGLMGAGCFIIALFVWAIIHGAKKQGAAEANAETAERQVDETVNRVKAGTSAVKSARDQVAAGKSPAEIKKANDAAWAKRGKK